MPTTITGIKRRGWKPTYESKVRAVGEVDRREVVDSATGVKYDTRFVKPGTVNDKTSSTPAPIEQSGSVPIQTAKREALRAYADEIAEKMQKREILIQVVPTLMSDKQAFRDAADKVRLNKDGIYKNFLSLYPEAFKIFENPKSNWKVKVIQRKKLRRISEADETIPSPPKVPSIAIVPVQQTAQPSRRLKKLDGTPVRTFNIT